MSARIRDADRKAGSLAGLRLRVCQVDRPVLRELGMEHDRVETARGNGRRRPARHRRRIELSVADEPQPARQLRHQDVARAGHEGHVPRLHQTGRDGRHPDANELSGRAPPVAGAGRRARTGRIGVERPGRRGVVSHGRRSGLGQGGNAARGRHQCQQSKSVRHVSARGCRGQSSPARADPLRTTSTTFASSSVVNSLIRSSNTSIGAMRSTATASCSDPIESCPLMGRRNASSAVESSQRNIAPACV